MLDVSIKMVKEYLRRHGYTDGHLNTMSNDELEAEYIKVTKSFINSYMNIEHSEDEMIDTASFADPNEISVYRQRVKENISDTPELIKILQEAYAKFDYQDILDAISIGSKTSAIKVQTIADIAYRSYQELLLSNIDESLEGVPKQEYKILKDYYENNRENINLLRKTAQKMKNQKMREQLIKMAHTKLMMVKDFMPDSMYDTYREYFNNTPEKISMVNKMFALTKMYSKDYLKQIPMERLQEMYNEVVEHNRQEEHDTKMFLKYSRSIQEAIYANDDDTFNEVCSRAVTYLTHKQMNMLMEYMSGQNPFFLSKFEKAIEDYKKKLKAK